MPPIGMIKIIFYFHPLSLRAGPGEEKREYRRKKISSSHILYIVRNLENETSKNKNFKHSFFHILWKTTRKTQRLHNLWENKILRLLLYHLLIELFHGIYIFFKII